MLHILPGDDAKYGHHHDTVADARACEAAREADEAAMQLGEIEAEKRNERWFEDRGANEPEDPRERYLWP